MLILGLDPSLSCTGWGVVRAEGSRIAHCANGQIKTDAKAPMAQRLVALQSGLSAIIADHPPFEFSTQARTERHSHNQL